ncbi:MAG: cytochrome c3 family protein [Trueperaceae bacterium]|nr:cytochrome c3 family protein [Trueperaceae bacterium]
MRKAAKTGLGSILFLGVILTLVGIYSPKHVFSLALAQESAPASPQDLMGDVPFFDAWSHSAHADITAEAFSHWNEDDPAVVPESCARCHSGTGYVDFIGADGSEAGVVNQSAAIGSVINCTTCHNSVTLRMNSAVMPSGLELTNLGSEARCVQCHQGRASKVSVDEAISKAAVAEDTVSPDLGFINIHYFAAAVSKYGTLAKGGYEYDGMSYDTMFQHVDGYTTCVQCHDPHSLEVKVSECSSCHENVTTAEDIKNVRMQGSMVDYDGDLNIEEGIYYELEGLQDTLYQMMQAYASEMTQTPLLYDSGRYPYFFNDANSNGTIDEGEGKFESFTPRLVKAAYNYQTSLKDPGAYAHGGKYIIQLLYDSIQDLHSALNPSADSFHGVLMASTNPDPIAFTPDIKAAVQDVLTDANLMNVLHRIDAGHFAGSEEAFRHWDAEGEVPGTCARCHTATGLPMLIKNGVTIAQPPSNGFQCSTCHNDLQEFTLHEVESVKFPSGAVVDSGNAATNICLNCHQGRESTVSVNALIRGINDDDTSDKLRFLNVHYFAAGATRFGSEVQGAYQYTGKDYVGLFEHDEDFAQCTSCHTTHGLTVKFDSCNECHEPINRFSDLQTIREYETDWDGDGNNTEGVFGEIATMESNLLKAMQTYSMNITGQSIGYDSHSYPYFFVDADGDGLISEEELSGRFNSWTPSLLRAAYNYQYVSKDPGSYVHNPHYIMQVLYDSLEDLGFDVSAMTRFDPVEAE